MSPFVRSWRLGHTTTAGARLAGALLAGATVLIGCSGTPDDRQVAPAPAPASGASTRPATTPAGAALPPAAQGRVECPDGRDRAFAFRTGGARLGGFVRGSGRRVAVLTHQSRGTPCDLAALGHLLASAGFRVVAWTADPGPDASELGRLVAEERRRGARYVALVGASLGAATSLVAAGRISPPVDAVVALSAAGQSERAGDVARGAGRYGGPLLAVAGEHDPSFARVLPELAAAHRGPEQVTLVRGSSDHGKDFVNREGAPMADEVLAFLRATLRP
jgi:hypothetical protein